MNRAIINAPCPPGISKPFPGTGSWSRHQRNPKPLAVRRGLWRHSGWDSVLVGLSLVQGMILIGWPSIPVVALGLWWNSNTVSHNFIHLPFFRSRTLNTVFSIYLSILLGIPQSLWRARHLAHHANRKPRLRRSRLLWTESAAVLALWILLATRVPDFFLWIYIPGYLLGLGLCQIHGYFEHWRGTVSHHGWLYNLLFFNDGYHREHHAEPGCHWRTLRQKRAEDTPPSRWPACLRWLETFSLDSLEKRVLHRPFLQHLLLGFHEKAFRKLLRNLPPVHRVVVVGGGLFPRSAMVLQKLLPQARIKVIDASPENIIIARRFVSNQIEFEQRLWEPADHDQADLVVIPLAFKGDRKEVYDRTQTSAVLVHDWIWRPHGIGVRVSWLLLKRLSLVQPGRS